ncbi:MAG: hypothetical protein J2P28_25010, partial [Actinobacteria bacterium]|nr:hypothetical protein [Actinomycetota bacterium]
PASQGTQVMAIISLVLGIISLPLAVFFWPIGLPAAIGGLVLGILSRRSPGRGLAIGGIVTSAVGLGLSVIVVLFVIASLARVA